MDPSKINDLSDLQSLLDLMGRYGLSEIEIQGEGRKIRLKKPEAQPVFQTFPYLQPGIAAPPGGALPATNTSPPAMASALQTEAAASSNLQMVTSPMVGTFYRASSPEADPYVREGDRVEETTILCIIEAMKVMNEIPAGVSGVVKEILVKNGESVEFGQPLFRVTRE